MTDHFQSRFICAFFALAHCLIWTMIGLNIILMVWHLTRPDENANKSKHFLRLLVESKKNLAEAKLDEDYFDS